MKQIAVLDDPSCSLNVLMYPLLQVTKTISVT